MPTDEIERLLIDGVRRGDEGAWSTLIANYEGRLLAYARARVRDINTAEDLVQEVFVGFLNGLPNYDGETPLESFLFSIASHKVIDYLRKNGRRPVVVGRSNGSSGAEAEPLGRGRAVSSLARSRERRGTEADLLTAGIREFLEECRRQGWWERMTVLELLWVAGWSNKRVAGELGISEQTVANHRSFVVRKLSDTLAPALVQKYFPEE